MDEREFGFAGDFSFEINPQAPLFIIGVASNMCHIPIWTLRKLDEMGVVTPRRMGKKTRCYSQVQIQKLHYIRYLIEDRGVNISGIKVILEISEPQSGENRKED